MNEIYWILSRHPCELIVSSKTDILWFRSSKRSLVNEAIAKEKDIAGELLQVDWFPSEFYSEIHPLCESTGFHCGIRRPKRLEGYEWCYTQTKLKYTWCTVQEVIPCHPQCDQQCQIEVHSPLLWRQMMVNMSSAWKWKNVWQHKSLNEVCVMTEQIT